MNELMTFNFDGATIRTAAGVDGEPWFVAADVCAALDITNVGNATARLDDDEKGIRTVDTLGGAQQLTIVNESGLYSLILGSRKPEAKRFKKWVTAEVLPAIRKTGGYGVAADPMAALKDPAARWVAARLGSALSNGFKVQRCTLIAAAVSASSLRFAQSWALAGGVLPGPVA